MKHLIMVIEDEEALALMLKYNLEKEGYDVWVEARGNKAIAEIEKRQPSVILLDWMLPELSGVDICKLIRSKPDIKNIPVIMLTAKGEEEDKIKGLSASSAAKIIFISGQRSFVFCGCSWKRRAKFFRANFY